MKFNKQEYGEYVKRRRSPSPIFPDMMKAYFVGGLICALGQLLFYLYEFFGLDAKLSMTLVTVTLIFVAAVLTGVGVFDKIAKFAGAGTLVPVTGFANAVVSPAIDTKSEGLVVGVGSKIFTVAGPVILFSVLCGTLYGVVLWILSLFGVRVA